MRLTHLSLSNFRNFTRLDIDVPGGPVLLVGDNAQGKTSLLEAIYYLATFTSFHASNDRQLISFLVNKNTQAVARIVAEFERGERRHRLEARIIQESESFLNGNRLRKEILLDGLQIKTGEAVGQFNAVLFLPHMLVVVDGAPEERRRYLNLALGQVVPAYPAALTEYNKALSQRNALLKQLSERNGDPAQLDYWDDLLVAAGAQLIHERTRAVLELEHQAALIHRELTSSSEMLRLQYQPSYDPVQQPRSQYALPLDTPLNRGGISIDLIMQGFRTCLVELRSEEIARGVTTIGPHRDELRFLSNGVDLGLYGSRGQVRTAMLALKLAEMTWMKQKTGHWPVLLLDEVLAELDAQRRLDLLQRLTQSEQSLLTTTDLDQFSPAFIDHATRWRIQGGRLADVTPPAV